VGDFNTHCHQQVGHPNKQKNQQRNTRINKHFRPNVPSRHLQSITFNPNQPSKHLQSISFNHQAKQILPQELLELSIFLLLYRVGIHHGIYQSSCNISNTAYLNSPLHHSLYPPPSIPGSGIIFLFTYMCT
jgi:hypothetical protein